jgi:hypothetical protein
MRETYQGQQVDQLPIGVIPALHAQRKQGAFYAANLSQRGMQAVLPRIARQLAVRPNYITGER